MSEKLTLTCISFRPWCQNTLRGFADVRIEQMRLVVHEVSIHQKNDKAWASLPSKPWIKNGEVVTDDSGKIKYLPMLAFDSAAVRTAFSNAVIRAVLAYDRRALECSGAA